jgi:hypothetical protein
MTHSELRSDVAGELDQMQTVVRELIALQRDVAGRSPTLREKVAAAGFLSQFYNGVENILKRITIYHGQALPEGERWHVALFERFCDAAPSAHGLPVLFDDDLAVEMARFRGFRHVMRSSYGMELQWSLMAEGIDRVQAVFARFEQAVNRALNDAPE